MTPAEKPAKKNALKMEGEESAQKLACAGVDVTCKRWLGCNHGFYFDYLPATCIALVERALRNAPDARAKS